MTRSSPILYWVLGLLGLCAIFGFYNGFSTAAHRDTPAWAGGSTLSTRPSQAAPPGYDPPDAQPLSDSPSVVTPLAPAADKPKPKDEAADKPGDTTATPVGEPKPVTLPPPMGGTSQPATATDKPKPPAKPGATKPKPSAPTPAPAAQPATPDAPPPAQQPAVPY